MAYVWNPLVTHPEMDIPYRDVEAKWNDKGHAIAYGPLRCFLDKYCALGLITLCPHAQAPVRIMRNLHGPDAAVLDYAWDIRRKQPEVELLTALAHRAVVYAFWLLLPLYIFLDRQAHAPHALVHPLSPTAVALVAFVVFQWALKRCARRTVMAAVALKIVGFVTLIVLAVVVLCSVESYVQALCFALCLGIAVGFVTEVAIYAQHYAIRRRVPTLVNRSFQRLGALVLLADSPIHRCYQALFGFVGLCLLALDFLLVCVQYFHTVWLFNRNVALRMLPPKA